MTPFRVFVTGTDTGIGKTEVSCALLHLLRERGDSPAALKPYESGGTSDSRRLQKAAGTKERCVVHQLAAPLAPAIAARLEKKTLSFGPVLSAFHNHDGRSLVVEGAGGLFVPVDEDRDVIDVIDTFRLPALLVARAGLGTLNHIALSLGALRGRGIRTLGIVLVQSTPKKDLALRHNVEWLKRWGLPILGPVPFIRSAKAREKAFVEALLRLFPERRAPGRARSAGR